MSDDLDFDPLALLRVLALEGVEFVVIGGIAAGAHGSPSATKDLDICYRREAGNLRKLAQVLKDLGAALRTSEEDVQIPIDAGLLDAADSFTFSTPMGSFDILRCPAGVESYEGLLANAVDFDLGTFSVKACSLDDLIKMKTAAGRLKDRIELEVLWALKQEIEKAGPAQEGS